jgi:hypothetical protein
VSQPPIGARHVLLAATAVVAIVLGLFVMSLWVPAVGDLMSSVPVLIVALVVVTLLVLLRALRPSP